MMPSVSLVSKTATALKKFIQNLNSDGNKLPNENDLADRLRVNRTTLRQALAILEYEGYIIRKQKVGTCINPYVIDIGLRLEDIEEILQQLKNLGFNPRVEHQDFTYNPATELIAKKLNIGVSTVLLGSQALFFANGIPAALVRDMIPLHLINKPMDIQILNQASIFGFLNDYCHAQVKHEVSEVIPVNCDQKLSEILELPLSKALLQVNSVVFDQNNNPVMYSELIYNDQFFNFNVVRRFIGF